MRNSNSTDQEKTLDTGIVSVGASLMAGIYQYNLLQKTNPNYSLKIKLAYCGGAAFICYFMTKTLLNNINNNL
jgi:hypothetical protein